MQDLRNLASLEYFLSAGSIVVSVGNPGNPNNAVVLYFQLRKLWR